MRRFNWSLLMLMGAVSCVPVPYPHKVIPHSYISGRAVDFVTGKPVSGVLVYVKSGGRGVITTADGRFELAPQEEWRFFCNVPLLPFEFWWRCGDEIVLSSHTAGPYRREHVGVNSCPVPFLMAYGRRENLDIHDELGDVPLLQEPPDQRR